MLSALALHGSLLFSRRLMSQWVHIFVFFLFSFLYFALKDDLDSHMTSAVSVDPSLSISFPTIATPPQAKTMNAEHVI
jgi:hypothetical protein